MQAAVTLMSTDGIMRFSHSLSQLFRCDGHIVVNAEQRPCRGFHSESAGDFPTGISPKSIRHGQEAPPPAKLKMD
jgi:hypothetical protein